MAMKRWTGGKFSSIIALLVIMTMVLAACGPEQAAVPTATTQVQQPTAVVDQPTATTEAAVEPTATTETAAEASATTPAAAEATATKPKPAASKEGTLTPWIAGATV